MSPGLTRGIGVAATIVTVGALAFSLSKGRRPLPVRPALDGLRFALSVGALVAAAAITGVSTPPALAAGACSWAECWGSSRRALKVRALEGRVLAQRTTLGVLLWGLAMVGVQGAGIASRSGLITVGQTVAWFSAGLSAGLLTARRPMIARARRALTGAAAAAVLVLGVGSFLAPAASATDVVMSDAEVCDLIPAYTNGYGEGFYSPAASGGGDLVASCEYTVSFSPDDLLNAYLELWETSGVAQGVYDRQVEVSRGTWVPRAPSTSPTRPCTSRPATGTAGRWAGSARSSSWCGGARRPSIPSPSPGSSPG
ncbi:MAG: hypothetical protein M5U14_20285 [Acidimicrobiia bacterium]|nr:hypothetical protein [Acidimicrobiia bacterium]